MILALEKQIEKLSDPDFDLDAWKKGMIVRLSTIYGPEDPKIEQIKDIKIDYSSWALRDSNSSYKPIESCKKMGKAIAEAVIDELKVKGIQQVEKDDHSDLLLNILDQSNRDEFEKFVDFPTDRVFKDFLRTLSKKELSGLIVTLLKRNR